MHFLNGTNLDFVKLGSDLMRDLATNEKQQKALSELHANLEGRGLKTVATTVENPGSLAILWNMGVNYIQGFFLQKPVTSVVNDYDD